MTQWELWFFFLLLLYLGFDTEEAAVKTSWREPYVAEVNITGSEPYVAQVCTNDTLNIITLIVCRVRTKRSREEQCNLLYQHGQDFKHECGSRFRLVTENQTVFLHLTSLTPDDSGSVICECSHTRGTNTVHLNITVEGDGESSISPLKLLSVSIVIGNGTALILVAGFVLGLALRKKYRRDHTRTRSCGTSSCGISSCLDKDEPDDPYASLQQPASDFYEDFFLTQQQRDRNTDSANNPNKRTIDQRETDQSCEIYENM